MTPDSLPTQRGSFRFLLLAAGITGIAIAIGWLAGHLQPGRGEPKPMKQETPSAARGEMLFGLYCTSCHGPEGRGDGPSAVGLRPPPRDFAVRPWRFAVTRDAIRTVILDGIPGTAMASNRAALTPDDVESLVEFVYALATKRPPIAHEPTADEQLLRDAGFIDLRGLAAPALAVTDSLGKGMKLTDLKGRLVLMHFWAADCPHCLKEMPAIKEFEAALAPRGFSVLHICTDLEDAKAAQALADRTCPGLRIFAEESGVGLARLEIQSLPTLWLIGPDGQSIGKTQGARDWSAPALRELIEHWLPDS